MSSQDHRLALDAAYTTAAGHLHQGDHRSAEELLLSSLDRAPRAAQSVFLLGLVKLAQRDIGSARRLIDRAYALKPWIREFDTISAQLAESISWAMDAAPDWPWPRYDVLRRRFLTPGLTFSNVCRLGILGTGTRFVQVGANDGVSSDPLREHVLGSAWTGLLVEPLPHVFASLRANYEGVDGLQFANAAVTDQPGTVTMYVEDQGRTTLASLVPDRNALSRSTTDVVEVEVPGRPLMALIDEHGIDRIDLLQIDTEGYDYQVLRQLDFGHHRPTVIHMEFYCLPLSERIATFELLADHDYVYRFLERDLLAVVASDAERVLGAGPASI